MKLNGWALPVFSVLKDQDHEIFVKSSYKKYSKTTTEIQFKKMTEEFRSTVPDH